MRVALYLLIKSVKCVSTPNNLVRPSSALCSTFECIPMTSAWDQLCNLRTRVSIRTLARSTLSRVPHHGASSTFILHLWPLPRDRIWPTVLHRWMSSRPDPLCCVLCHLSRRCSPPLCCSSSPTTSQLLRDPTRSSFPLWILFFKGGLWRGFLLDFARTRNRALAGRLAPVGLNQRRWAPFSYESFWTFQQSDHHRRRYSKQVFLFFFFVTIAPEPTSPLAS